MTRAEYYRNYKLSRKLTLLDITWIVLILAAWGWVTFGSRGWFDSWFMTILLCFIWMLSFSILMAWISAKKLRKFNLICSACQNDISVSVGMTIATGKCQKCGCDLFELDTAIDQPPYIVKTKIQLLEFRSKLRKQMWMFSLFWGISFIGLLFVLVFLIAYFNWSMNRNVGRFIPALMLAGIYLIGFLPSLRARKKGFICPTCKSVLCYSRMELAVKTGNCSKCGKKLFEER